PDPPDDLRRRGGVGGPRVAGVADDRVVGAAEGRASGGPARLDVSVRAGGGCGVAVAGRVPRDGCEGPVVEAALVGVRRPGSAGRGAGGATSGGGRGAAAGLAGRTHRR